MRIETGHPSRRNVQTVNANRVRFVNEDGDCLFEVMICGG